MSDLQERLDVEELRALFDGRSGSTIGIEEELMLLDPATLEIEPSVDVASLLDDEARFAPELRAGQLEIRTPVCGNAVAAALCLADAILYATDRLGASAVLASAGTHPVSSTRGDVPCALHVHVAVPGADRALAVYNAARSYLPELTALAANSPFLDGVDTGLASARGGVVLAFHRVGVPPAFPTWEAYVAAASHPWWDLRPHPGFGTIELRSLDSQTRVDDAAAIAALFQCLLVWLSGLYDEHGGLPVHDRGRIADNLSRARRRGTGGHMADLVTGEPEATRSRIQRLLEQLEPTASKIGDDWALLTASTLLSDNGADRQRYVAAEHGLEGLVRWLVHETVASPQVYLERRA